jgi:hypothetical protein
MGIADGDGNQLGVSAEGESGSCPLQVHREQASVEKSGST